MTVATEKFRRISMTQKERRTLLKVLNAAGEVLVTRALTRVCVPSYTNQGWSNCFFAQMFGGKANLNRMVEAERKKTFRQNMGYEAAIAHKLGVEEEDIDMVVGLFDQTGIDFVGTGEFDDHGNEIEEPVRKSWGKVASLIRYTERWLAKRGIILEGYAWTPSDRTAQ